MSTVIDVSVVPDHGSLRARRRAGRVDWLGVIGFAGVLAMAVACICFHSPGPHLARPHRQAGAAGGMHDYPIVSSRPGSHPLAAANPSAPPGP